jgi:hypothetical protein
MVSVYIVFKVCNYAMDKHEILGVFGSYKKSIEFMGEYMNINGYNEAYSYKIKKENVL